MGAVEFSDYYITGGRDLFFLMLVKASDLCHRLGAGSVQCKAAPRKLPLSSVISIFELCPGHHLPFLSCLPPLQPLLHQCTSVLLLQTPDPCISDMLAPMKDFQKIVQALLCRQVDFSSICEVQQPKGGGEEYSPPDPLNLVTPSRRHPLRFCSRTASL